MKKIIHNLSKINRRHVQLMVMLITLCLLVIGAGAPGSSGGIGGF